MAIIMESVIINNKLKPKKSSFNDILTVQDRLKKQKEPSNLAIYIKDRYPFDRWNQKGITL
ncbi:MAG: hypothetical protein ABZF75_00995 [Columbia Basin potato purple top phytoplasma]